jgi:hypothetical protein
LDDLEKYFRSAAPLSEDKAIATLATIFARITRHFPLVSSLHNISRRLSKDLRDKINDVPPSLRSAPRRPLAI